MKKIFLMFAFAICLVLPFTFVLAGCEFNFSGNTGEEQKGEGQQQEQNVELQNGTYEITTYSVDGVNQTHLIGGLVTVNNGTITDSGNLIATYVIAGNRITVTYNTTSQVLQGTVTTNSITINETNDESHSYTIVMNKVENVELQNGTYEVTRYVVNGANVPEYAGGYVLINNGTMTFNEQDGTYVIVGNRITVTFIDSYQHTFIMKGTITTNSITINETNDELHSVTIVMNKVN